MSAYDLIRLDELLGVMFERAIERSKEPTDDPEQRLYRDGIAAGILDASILLWYVAGKHLTGVSAHIVEETLTALEAKRKRDAELLLALEAARTPGGSA